MNDVSRRQWLGSTAVLGVAAAVAGTAAAQSRPSADDFIRTVKGARMFDLSFTWNEQSPLLSLNPPYAFALNRTHKMTYEITGAHLEQTAKAQGVDVRRGDSVLVRTGWGQYFAKDNAKYLGEQSPGPGQDGARWIIDRGVRLAGDDTATFEKRPAAYGKELFSVHMMLLADNGIYIVENCNLEAMADAKAYVALLILTPLRIQGATGSPLRAIALAP